MDTKIKNYVYKTKNYKQFKKLKTNREVNKAHIRSIAKSMKIKNLLIDNPIKVDKKFQVLDGQHRLEAAKLNEDFVYYIIATNLSDKDVPRLNSSQKNWRAIDYVDYHAANNNENYKKLKLFMGRYNVSVSIAIQVLLMRLNGMKNREQSKSEAIYSTSMMKAGHFKYPEDDSIGHKAMASIKSLAEIIRFQSASGLKAFASCIIELMNDDDRYEHERLMSKVKISNLEKLSLTQNKTGMMGIINDIYNFRVREKKNLVYFRITK